MEIQFPYREDKITQTSKSPSGTINRPYALVKFKLPDGTTQPISFLVDSGADVTILPFSMGTMFGKDVKQGERFPISGIGKGSLDTYLHEIEATVGDHTFMMTVAFAETDNLDGRPVPSLLGRMDVFDIFDVFFKQRLWQTHFVKP